MLKSSPDWTKKLGNFNGKLFVKLDFGVVKSSPMYQNFNVLTYFHPGNNGQSVFHRYHGPIDHYLTQGDFDGPLSITRQSRGIRSVQTNPQKKFHKTSKHFLCQIFRNLKSVYWARRTVVPKTHAVLGGVPPSALRDIWKFFIQLRLANHV